MSLRAQELPKGAKLGIGYEERVLIAQLDPSGNSLKPNQSGCKRPHVAERWAAYRAKAAAEKLASKQIPHHNYPRVFRTPETP